jgi:hypothetical protein
VVWFWFSVLYFRGCDGVLLELGIWVDVRGPIHLTRGPHGLWTNFFGPFKFLLVWVGLLKP